MRTPLPRPCGHLRLDDGCPACLQLRAERKAEHRTMPNCVMRCMRYADGYTSDGFDEPGVPICIPCVIQLAERESALDENPWLTLPEFDPLVPDALR